MIQNDLTNEEPDYLFSVKLPTNSVGSFSGPQDMKLDLREEATESRRNSDYLSQVDHALGENPDVIILKEVLVIRDRKTGNALVVRDITPLKSGYHYLPAFSLPYMGQEISNRFRKPFGEFWASSYEALGKAEAMINIKYAMTEANQSPQNWKIELDESMRPTGRVVLIDTGDWHVFRPIADVTHLGSLGASIPEDTKFHHDQKFWLPFSHSLFGGWTDYYSNPPKLNKSITGRWEQAFIDGYRSDLERQLGVPAPQLGDSPLSGTNDILYQYFTSPRVRNALRQYHGLVPTR